MIATRPAPLLPVSVSRLAEATGLSRASVSRRVHRLVDEKRLRWEVTGRQGPHGGVNAYSSVPEWMMVPMILGLERRVDRRRWPLPKFLAIAVAEGRA